MVELKVTYRTFGLLALLRFNRSMVELKVSHFALTGNMSGRFNRSMVELKADGRSKRCCEGDVIQSIYGRIERRYSYNHSATRCEIQSIYGRIERKTGRRLGYREF